MSLLVVACAHVPSEPTSPQPASFSMDVSDDESAQAFTISVASRSKVPLCIATEGWPSDRGTVSEVFDVKLLHAGGERKADGYHPAQCIGGCEPVVIAPGGRLAARIAYSNFGKPDEIAALRNKKLAANVHAHACTAADFPQEIR